MPTSDGRFPEAVAQWLTRGVEDQVAQQVDGGIDGDTIDMTSTDQANSPGKTEDHR